MTTGRYRPMLVLSNGLVEGNIYRKPWLLPPKLWVSCGRSLKLKPLHTNSIRYSIQYCPFQSEAKFTQMLQELWHQPLAFLSAHPRLLPSGRTSERDAQLGQVGRTHGVRSDRKVL